MAFTFGPFTLSEAQRQVFRGDQPLHLSRKAFDLLVLLIRERPAAVPKTEIHAQLWPDTFVSDGNLAVLVAEIRDALDDDSRRPHYVRTIHRVGYAFAAAVEDRPTSESLRQHGTPYWVGWSAGRARLMPGENVIGRGPDVDVLIDGKGVSRRHATITVADDAVMLRDLDSKNGTFVNDVRIVSPTALVEDVEIRLGPTAIRFRRVAGGESTETWSVAKSRG